METLVSIDKIILMFHFCGRPINLDFAVELLY